jgi:hypothetical protein
VLPKSVNDRQSVGGGKFHEGVPVAREKDLLQLDENLSLSGRSERGPEFVRGAHADDFHLNPQRPCAHFDGSDLGRVRRMLGISQNGHAGEPRNDFLEQLHAFRR